MHALHARRSRNVAWLAVALAVTLSASAAAQPSAPRAAHRTSAAADSAAAVLDSLARDANGVALQRDALHTGAQTVAAGQTVSGSIASWHGPLDVYGTVTGNAVAIDGDVIVHQGATVRGDAVAVGGHVRLAGGTVAGEMRTLSAFTVGALAAHAAATPAEATKRSVSLAVGWYLVLAVIGVFTAVFARPNLETVAEQIRSDFSRSLLYGVVAQLAFLPAVSVVIVLLAITIIGVLAIPFAIVGFILGAAGAIALGFLAVSYVTGDATMRWRGAVSPYAPPPVVQFVLIGLSLYLVLWMLGGLFAWAGWFGVVLRFIAAMVTWVAATVGIGATLASRAGTRVAAATPPRAVPAPAPELDWQTPTPVSGVAAARRPTPPRSRRP